ncbi:hypothetical protein VNO80_18558 [Phaseolus coccineus]|uniref:Uncharacterized protein n=1 Tax=Phaseolus coccineus TaxID=3886 RepID=A0AAN9QZT6_PHACN
MQDALLLYAFVSPWVLSLFGVQYLVVPLSKISIFLGPSPFPIFNFNLRLNSNFFCSIRGFSRLNFPPFVSHQVTALVAILTNN